MKKVPRSGRAKLNNFMGCLLMLPAIKTAASWTIMFIPPPSLPPYIHFPSIFL